MSMLINGAWEKGVSRRPVLNPFDGSIVGETASGRASDIERALLGLKTGAQSMAKMPPHERAQKLLKVSQLLDRDKAKLAESISREMGKALVESTLEVQRAREVFEISSEEARRITGEMIPLEGTKTGQGKIGFTIRVPCGIVAAITPFNFPLNLVAHKTGPALAAGNALLIKPASTTPLTALLLVEILLEAGFPPEALAIVPGPGKELGEAICRSPLVRKISFTGSYPVGETICQSAGVKRITMELGSNCPVVVCDDADLQLAARAIAAAGYANAGQTCISTQRVLASPRIMGYLLDELIPLVREIRTGDPLQKSTRMGPLVSETEAVRVASWIEEAVAQGAKIECGGDREKGFVSPTILSDVDPSSIVSCQELFGPVVALTAVENFEEALRLANATRYGLSAGIFTKDLGRAMRFVREMESGNIQVNWSSQWRADLMPYGGLKESGFGKEGPKYAIQEMTEEKMIVIHENS